MYKLGLQILTINSTINRYKFLTIKIFDNDKLPPPFSYLFITHGLTTEV